MHKNLALLFIASTLSACGQSPSPSPSASSPSPRLSLMQRLTQEATTRPPAHPPVETVVAALGSKGLPLEGWKQVLASPIGARFCMAGQTPHGLAVAVCEFADEAEAERGIAYSKRTFDALIPNRTLVRRASTVLTVTRPQPGSIDEARAITAITAIFATL